jgi:hypothetical protein
LAGEKEGVLKRLLIAVRPMLLIVAILMIGVPPARATWCPGPDACEDCANIFYGGTCYQCTYWDSNGQCCFAMCRVWIPDGMGDWYWYYADWLWCDCEA